MIVSRFNSIHFFLHIYIYIYIYIYILKWKVLQYCNWSKVSAVVDSITVGGALARCALLHSVWDLKAAKANVQWSQIRALMLYELKMGHDTAEATKDICGVKGEDAVTRWLKNFNDQSRSGRSKTVESKAVLQPIEANLASSTRRVSGELGTSQPSAVHQLHNLCESIQNCGIVPHSTKI